MAHLLPIAFAVVRQHVDDQQPAPRLQHTRHLGEGLPRFGQVMQHERQRRRIQARIVDRQRFEIAAPELHILEPLQTLPGGLQHGGGCINRDDAADERRERRRQLARAAAEIADGPLGVCERGKGREVKALAEQVVANAIPLAGRRREKLLGLGAALGKYRLHATLVVHGGRRRSDLLADQRP